jgi:hypothetical protein
VIASVAVVPHSAGGPATKSAIHAGAGFSMVTCSSLLPSTRPSSSSTGFALIFATSTP